MIYLVIFTNHTFSSIIKTMLTQKDVEQIEKQTRKILKQEIKHLPTKDDFYNRMDELIGEVKSMREEQTLIAGKISEHTDSIENHEYRIGKLEEILVPPQS